MDILFSPVDWGRVLLPSMPILELLVRGSVSYLVLFAMLRFALKRQAGTVGIADLLVVVLVADAIQNGMAGDYYSIADGLILVATIVFWNYSLDWLGYRFPSIQRLIHPPPLCLVKNGKILRRNLGRELLTEEELMTALRKQGVDDVKQVKIAQMEGDGHISVVTYNGQGHSADDTMGAP